MMKLRDLHVLLNPSIDRLHPIPADAEPHIDEHNQTLTWHPYLRCTNVDAIKNQKIVAKIYDNGTIEISCLNWTPTFLNIRNLFLSHVVATIPTVKIVTDPNAPYMPTGQYQIAINDPSGIDRMPFVEQTLIAAPAHTMAPPSACLMHDPTVSDIKAPASDPETPGNPAIPEPEIVTETPDTVTAPEPESMPDSPKTPGNPAIPEPEIVITPDPETPTIPNPEIAIETPGKPAISKSEKKPRGRRKP